jgi:cold shock CspA family protein
MDLVNQAAGLSPAFYEVDRVRGFILSSAGSTDSATASYEMALTKSPTEWHRARVAYLFAGHLARQAKDAQAAKPYAEMADAVFDNIETKVQLALLDVYLGELDGAIASLTSLLEKAEGKQQRIIATSLMDALRRKSESTWVDLQLGPDALLYCLRGARLGSSFFATGVGDNRMIEVCVESIRDGVGMVARSPHLKVLHPAAIELLEIFVRHQTLFQYAPGYSGVVKSAQRLAKADGDGVSAKLRALCEQLCAGVTAGEDHLDLALGTVKHWRADKGFGFISSSVGDVFFHKSAVVPPNFLAFVRHGAPVAFKAIEGRPGLKADMITLFPGGDPDPNDLLKRRLTVTDRPAGRDFLFATDMQTGMAVFVHRTVVNSIEAWNRLHIGTEFLADVQLVGDDRLRVVRGSVEVQ